MAQDLQTIVQRMIDAGEPEESIAEVIRAYPTETGGGSLVTPTVAAGLSAAKAAPAIVSGIGTAANAIKGAAQSKVGRMTPGVIALDAAGDVLRGDMKGAATSTATAVAASQVPRAASMVQQATKPAVQRMVRFGGELLPVGAKQAAGPLMRGAGWLSRIAGKAALPAGLASGAYDSWQMIQELVKRQADESVDPREREAILRALQGEFVN